MRTLNNTLILLMLTILLFSCDDILEEDITNDMVQTISPNEGATIDGNTVQFLWQNLDGADSYRIQIIKSNQVFEIDSLISTTNFKVVLNSGTYQWRVRAENFAYNTDYTFPVNFSVETSDDLSNQNVALSTPSVDLYTNNKNITFTWQGITSAISCKFELIKSLNGEQTILPETDVTTSNYTIDPNLFNDDAKYVWKVKAVNATSETVYSQRFLFIDTVAPNQPTLTSPADQSTATTTATFNWTNGTDSGNIKSTITNTIEIASDIGFNTKVHSANTVNNTYQYVFSTLGTYYWRVKAIDAATNESDFSIVRSLVVE